MLRGRELCTFAEQDKMKEGENSAITTGWWQKFRRTF